MFTTNTKGNITSTCKLLGFSRQVYYRARALKKKRQSVAQQVIGLVLDNRMQQPKLGTRKLYYLLKDDLNTLGVGRDRLFSILRANKMLIQPKKSYYITTNSHHRFRKHKNLIEHLDIVRPEQVWVADITYVGNRKNPMYLSLITDAYSKKIVGHHLANTLETQASVKALQLAIKRRKYQDAELIHHSDRGLQYCSNLYQNKLKVYAIQCSMTESYDPYQNAIAERVNGILKQEFLLNTSKLNIQLMRKIVKQSIEIYNNKRPHLSCNYLTPNQMHKQNKLKRKTYKSKKHQESILS